MKRLNQSAILSLCETVKLSANNSEFFTVWQELIVRRENDWIKYLIGDFLNKVKCQGLLFVLGYNILNNTFIQKHPSF